MKNPSETKVVILASSDMHGDIWGYSYEDSRETSDSGMARLYTYIKQVREENGIVFLIDGGDEIQGTILTDDIANKSPDNPHPVIEAMNFMDYDCMTLGNHEFNWGVTNLMKILSRAKFPVLAANIQTPSGELLTGSGWKIIERGGVKLAVIGVCTPDVPVWDNGKEGVDGLIYGPAYAAVSKALREIGNKADIILVSAHMGQLPEFDTEGKSDSGNKIIEENPDIDILQVAHIHTTVDDVVSGVPTAGVRSLAREIVRFDVTLDEDKRIRKISQKIVKMDNVQPSDEIRSIPLIAKMHKQTISLINGTTGENGQEIKPIGFTTAKFQPENEIRCIPESKLRDTPVIDLLHKIQLIYSKADVTSCSFFKDDSDLPEGTLNYGNIFDIYKFDNTLIRTTVSGKELKAYMEWTAGYYNQWHPGDINVSFDPNFPGFLYDMFAGVYYEINISKPRGERIENVLFHGKPLQDDEILSLAINNYTYSAVIKARNISKGKREWESSGSIRDMIVSYFRDNSPVSPITDNNWRITGIDLNRDDPRRAELIGYINEGCLPAPYHKSYNLADYSALKNTAEANRDSGIIFSEEHNH